MLNQKETYDYLNKFAKYVIQQSRSNLTKQGKKNQGALYNSLGSQIEVGKNSFVLTFLMEDYGDFVDKGVKGFGGVNAKPKNVLNSPYKFRSPYPNEKMIKSLEEWYKLGKAKVRTESQKTKLSASQSKNKRISQIPKKLTLRDIATMTAFAIKRDGLRTTNFVGKAIGRVFDKDFYDTMALALTRDIDLQVKQMVNKTNDNGNNN